VPFRDLAIFLIVFGGIPFILRQPAIGVMYWAWISLMNPHRQAWGPAYDFQFGMLIAVVTFIALVVSKEPKQMKGGGSAVVLLIFVCWTCLTTIYALVPESAVGMLERTVKIQLFTFVALFVLYKREHVIWLIGVIVLSIGYYAVKGGVFTILTGGNFRVWGPAESFIADNNALALASVMTIPLWGYLFVIFRNRWQRMAIGLAIGLTAASALGSYSRGALLAIVAMSIFLWLKGRKKLMLGVAVAIAAVGLAAFMPSAWEERMRSIGEYQVDSSANGRLETWKMLFNLALDRPLIGGGFEPYRQWIVDTYNPSYGGVHAAHSIYFQVLGEQGFVGLGLFLLFWALVWRMCSQVARISKGKQDERWAYWLAQMIKVSLVAYFVGGTFLNLAYWDMPYFLFVAIAVTHKILRQARSPLADNRSVDRSVASVPANAQVTLRRDAG